MAGLAQLAEARVRFHTALPTVRRSRDWKSSTVHLRWRRGKQHCAGSSPKKSPGVVPRFDSLQAGDLRSWVPVSRETRHTWNAGIRVSLGKGFKLPKTPNLAGIVLQRQRIFAMHHSAPRGRAKPTRPRAADISNRPIFCERMMKSASPPKRVTARCHTDLTLARRKER